MTSPAARLVSAARHLAGRGLSPGSSGNLSVRDGERVLITPTGSSLSRVCEQDLAVVGMDGTVASGRPSKEYPLHLAVYRNRPSANAVVHLHSPHVTALSCIETEGPALLPLTPYHAMRFAEVPLLDYAAPGSAALAAGVEHVIADSAAVLLGNHGSVVAGSDLDAAVDLSEELESAAQIQLLLRGIPTRPLPAGEAARLRPDAP